MPEIVAIVALAFVALVLLVALLLQQRGRERETAAWREVLAARSLTEYAAAKTTLAKLDLKRVTPRAEHKSDPYSAYLNDDRRNVPRGSNGS